MGFVGFYLIHNNSLVLLGLQPLWNILRLDFDILTLSSKLNFKFWVVVFPRNKITLSLFFLLALTGLILTDECFLLLYFTMRLSILS